MRSLSLLTIVFTLFLGSSKNAASLSYHRAQIERPKICFSDGSVVFLDTLNKTGMVKKAEWYELYFRDSGHIEIIGKDKHMPGVDTLFVPAGQCWCLTIGRVDVQVGDSSILMFKTSNEYSSREHSFWNIDGVATFQIAGASRSNLINGAKSYLRLADAPIQEGKYFFDYRDYLSEAGADLCLSEGTILFCSGKFSYLVTDIDTAGLDSQKNAAVMNGIVHRSRHQKSAFPVLHSHHISYSNKSLATILAELVDLYSLKGYRIEGLDPNRVNRVGETEKFPIDTLLKYISTYGEYFKLQHDSIIVKSVPW